MVSDQFLKDYRQMTAQGVTFTPRDIVRLNAFAVLTQRSSTAAQNVFLPRLAFMPRDSWWRVPIVLREPTLAHELWTERAERWIDTGKSDNFLALNAYALSRRAERLPDPDRPRKVIRAVFGFAKARLARFTRAQLIAAVEYALYGADWTAGEIGPAAKKKENGDASLLADGSPSPTIGLLTTARIMRLPISLAEAMRMTASELTQTINRCVDEVDGRFDRERSRNRAFRNYVLVREEIRSRSIDKKGQ